MRILIIGVGDAFTRTHFSSSALVEAPQGYVLIDCGDLVHRAVHDAAKRAGWSVDASRIDDVLVTHLHGDHCNGLESFGFFRRILKLRQPSSTVPRLHVAEPVAQRLWQRLAPAMDAPMTGQTGSTLADYFDVHILEPDHPTIVAGLTVRCRFTKHPIPTIGLILDSGAESIAWSSDTPFEQQHVDWLNQADLIIHESNRGPAHTAIESLNALPAAVRSKIRLIHLPDDFDPRSTDIAILHEGDVLDL